MNLIEHLIHQIGWSRKTFGPADRQKGVVDHIRKELVEIENAKGIERTREWVDVIILGLDGAWRSLPAPWSDEEKARLLVALITEKQARNEERTWPDWRTMSEDQAIEHDRSAE